MISRFVAATLCVLLVVVAQTTHAYYYSPVAYDMYSGVGGYGLGGYGGGYGSGYGGGYGGYHSPYYSPSYSSYGSYYNPSYSYAGYPYGAYGGVGSAYPLYSGKKK